MNDEKNLPVPAWFDPKRIIAEILEGKRTEDIARGLGVSREKLVYHLTTRAPEDWKAAQFLRSLKRKEEAEDEIDAADDMLKLNRANAKLKSAQWDLERVCRRIYGDVKEPETMRPVVINIGIDRNRGRVEHVVGEAE
jgi:transposase-like protein